MADWANQLERSPLLSCKRDQIKTRDYMDITGNIGQIPTWVKLGSNLGNNNSQLLKLGYSWGKVGFYFKS